MGTGSFPGVKYGQGVLLTPHPLLVPLSWKSRAVPLPSLWATTGPVKGTLYTFPLSQHTNTHVSKTLIVFPEVESRLLSKPRECWCAVIMENVLVHIGYVPRVKPLSKVMC